MSLPNRKSPSGPRPSTLAPFNGCTPQANGTFFIHTGEQQSSGTEADATFRLPARGQLDRLVVLNAVSGADPVITVYQVRINGVNVGSSAALLNNTTDKVEIDLSDVTFVEDDLLSLQYASPTLEGAAPKVKTSLTYILG